MPAIILMNELDAQGQARSAFDGLNGQDEKEQARNQSLAKLVGSAPDSGVALLAASNRPAVLDAALRATQRHAASVKMLDFEETVEHGAGSAGTKRVDIASDRRAGAPEQATAKLTGRRVTLQSAAMLLLTRETLSSVEPAELIGEDHGS